MLFIILNALHCNAWYDAIFDAQITLMERRKRKNWKAVSLVSTSFFSRQMALHAFVLI